ncbi:hypothetical protein E4U53_003681 [Claviceps sorghi]|nr:hypothetical protein E4U53_003681 [Claviceps sorghi]
MQFTTILGSLALLAPHVQASPWGNPLPAGWCCIHLQSLSNPKLSFTKNIPRTGRTQVWEIKEGCKAMVITQPDCQSWDFNVLGCDDVKQGGATIGIAEANVCARKH